MDQKLKERVMGAAVLVAIAVIFIPILLTGSSKTELISGSHIPTKPKSNFNSRIIPVFEDNRKALSTPIEPNDIGVLDDQGRADSETNQKITVEKIVSNDDEKIDENLSKEVEEKQENELKADVGLSAWIIQLGSFSNEDNAQSLNQELRRVGYPAFVEPLKKNGEISYRVRVGPEIKRSEAELVLKELKDQMELDGIVVSYP